MIKKLENIVLHQNQSTIFRSRLAMIKSHRLEIFKLAAKYGASNIKFFRGIKENKTDDDQIYFLVNLEQNRNINVKLASMESL